MSADNWTQCPQCQAWAETRKQQLQERVKKEYGVLPKDEYLKLVTDADKPISLDETLREDYEIYVDSNGDFKVDYGCSCSVCGFSFDYKHEQTVELKPLGKRK